MSIADDVQNTNETVLGCKVCAALEAIEVANDRTAIVIALASPKFEHSRIAEILTNNGYPITEASVRRHRKNHNVNK